MTAWVKAHCTHPLGTDGQCCCSYCEGYEDGRESARRVVKTLNSACGRH